MIGAILGLIVWIGSTVFFAGMSWRAGRRRIICLAILSHIVAVFVVVGIAVSYPATNTYMMYTAWVFVVVLWFFLIYISDEPNDRIRLPVLKRPIRPVRMALRYWRPRRLTLKYYPGVYAWLWWNF